MTKYIELEALKNRFTKRLVWLKKDIHDEYSLGLYDGCEYDTKLIDEIPAADVAPVRHGRWVLGNVEPGYFTPGGNRPWICSECEKVISWMLGKPKESYCPNCGARMDGGAGNGC